jgi:phage protein U
MFTHFAFNLHTKKYQDQKANTSYIFKQIEYKGRKKMQVGWVTDDQGEILRLGRKEPKCILSRRVEKKSKNHSYD